VGQRHVQRLRREAGRRVPPAKRKLVRRGVSTGLPTKATHRGHVWTWDFIAAATVRGGALRMLTILDEYTPGSPWQNGFVESFHGRFRDECLNREQLWTLTEARVVIADYRDKYNQRRPHSRLGYLSPVRFAAQLCPSPTSVGLRPPCVGDGQNQNRKVTSTPSSD